MLQRLTRSEAPSAILLVRLMVGGVFLSEGIQKFRFADQLGAGRFAKIGLPAPELLAPLVGGVEIVCGALVLVGLLTRLTAVPLLVVISVALLTTKLPMLSADGFWHLAHEARTDACMFLGSLLLILLGGGPRALDARLSSRRGPEGGSDAGDC